MICCGLDMKFWPEVSGSVIRALNPNQTRLSIDDIERALQAQEMQLWGIHDGQLHAVMITELVTYPKCKAVRILTVTGEDMNAWLDVLIHTLQEWGRENGASLLEFTGRKGWERALKDHGWVEPYLTMTRYF
jgi:hypothetical protein